MKRYKFIFILFISNQIYSQNFNPDSLSQLKKRFSFATMYFGIEGISTSNGTLPILNSSNTIEKTEFSGYNVPRLVWGATHFWGHSDIYVSFPLGSYNKSFPNQITELDYNLGVETGIKVYPYKLKTNSLRPYFGMAWNISSFQQTQIGQDTSISLSQNTTPILFGLSYRGKRTIFETGIQYFFDNKFDYPVSRTINGNLELPEFVGSFSAKYLLETTYKNGENIKKRMSTLEKYNKYNAFYLGIGPSASIGIPTFSEFDKEKYPFFRNHKRYLGIIPEFTVGYYFQKPNFNVGFSYRSMNDGYEGFGVQHYHERKSFMIESYKFLGDYHGFNPFIGITASNEKLLFATRDVKINDVWSKFYETKQAIGLIIGWDIKPTKAESWLLRTNLRYTPLSMIADGKKVAYDYIEFNFIQLVLFPERIFAQYKENKK
jgi:hypothetical protein